jgi:hypothetical protein
MLRSLSRFGLAPFLVLLGSALVHADTPTPTPFQPDPLSVQRYGPACARPNR